MLMSRSEDGYCSFRFMVCVWGLGGGRGGSRENTLPKCFCVPGEEKLFRSLPIVFFLYCGWELCHSSIPKPIHNESNGNLMTSLDQKGFVSWSEFYFPGGLWPRGVGWILRKPNDYTLTENEGRPYLVVKSGDNRALTLWSVASLPCGRSDWTICFTDLKCWEGLFILPKIIDKKELLIPSPLRLFS